MKNPLVSIVINNYNYGNYVQNSIVSALNQTYENFEIIVVDDGSTDHSRDVICKYEREIIAVYKENGGQASALNRGFQLSQGEIICFLDSDDVFLNHKVLSIVNAYLKDSTVDWFFHPLKLDNAESLNATKQEFKMIGERTIHI